VKNTIEAMVLGYKTDKAPLSSYIKHFVEFFIHHVHQKPLLCLWI
jgi:hypothetical protein